MYRGTFKDIDNNEYTVDIIPKGTEGHVDEIILSSNPVTISRKSDNLFTEIKPLSCTIEIVTDKILTDLYSSNLKDVEVNVYLQSIKIFSGYLTPYIYNQPYANTLDTIQLECVSKMSVLKEIDYSPINGMINKEIVSFKDIIWRILTFGAGYSQDTLNIAWHLGTEKNLSEFKISEANFFDDDDAKTPWKMDEVLTHICRYLGVSCIEYEDDWIYFVDYQQVANSTNFYYKYYGMLGKTSPDIVRSKCAVCGYTVDYYDVPQQCSSCGQRGTMQKVEPYLGEAGISYNGQDKTSIISKDAHISTDAVISYDDIYNKLEVEANAYKLDMLCNDLCDEKNNNSIFTVSPQKYSLSLSGVDQYSIYTTSKIANTRSGWKHRFYRMKDGSESTTAVSGTIYESDYYGSNYNNLFYRINHRCAVVRQVTSEELNSPTPVKLDFEDYIAFYCLDDTVAPLDPANYVYTDYYINGDSMYKIGRGGQEDTFVTKLEQPVLEYTSDIPIKYCPESGTSWITIKGDLWYQSNYQDLSNNIIMRVINPDDQNGPLYAQWPYDGMIKTSEYRPKATNDFYTGFYVYNSEDRKNYKNMYFPARSSSDADYGKGFPMLKCSLQIGDYYWDADYQGWTNQPATFYINYNNSPSGGAEETFNCLAWQTIAPNHTYEDKIGENCWAIPIKKSVDGHKVTGKLKFTLYTPSQLKPLYDNWYNTYGHTYGLNWNVLFPVIYMKGFELNYVYTDNLAWWQPSNEKDDDIVYSNTVSAGFNREHDAVEFKVNSYSDGVPISRSYVLDVDNNFMTSVTNYDTNGSYIMEKHYIEKLLNHYQNKKLIYEASIKYIDWYSHDYTRLDPRIKHYLNFESINTFKNNEDNKIFLVDSFEINCKENTAKVKYIEW